MTNTINNIRNMRLSNGVKLGALCVATAIIAACSTTEAPGPVEPSGATGRVRLVNVITDVTRGRVNASLEGIVFTVDLQYGQAAPANLPAPATAPYAAVYTGNRSFVLKRTADTTVTVATLPFSVTDGQDLSVYAIGGAGGSAVTSFITTDDNTPAAATTTRLRVVNMSPAAGAVDVFVTAAGANLSTATPVVSNLAYKATSAYVTVAPGTYVIRAVPAGTAPANRNTSVTVTSVTATVATVSFPGGTGRTVVLADNLVDPTVQRAIVIVDR